MNIVAIVSGGLDSAVMLGQFLREKHQVRAFSCNYGQRHVKELAFASDLSRLWNVRHEIADLRGIAHLLAGSSLTSPEIPVPDGHYTEERMKSTVVPNRNMIMIAIAVGWAVSLKFDAVAFAAHSGDHAIYPDCREEFAEALDRACRLADWRGVALLRPFVNKTKAEIVSAGAEIGVPFERTWSCYKGGEIHCGVCGTCVERREAFTVSGVTDPTRYEA